MSDLALPDDAVLLHIGVHKTGSTALQGTFASNREDLAEHGILYPGKGRAHGRQAMAVTGRVWGWKGKGGKKKKKSLWEGLVEEVTEYPGRVIVSSEFFCEADDEAAARVVEELGRDRLQVVVTLRPLAKLLPSSWQQYLKYGLSPTYEEWLADAFRDPPNCSLTPTFWKRHDHAAVVTRWARLVGPENVTVIVLDETDRNFLFDCFEQMLTLPNGYLSGSAEEVVGNRSMSAPEAEFIRSTNKALKGRVDWDTYNTVVRFATILRMVEMRRPGPDEPATQTPEWAVQKAVEMGRGFADVIEASGVRIVGDLDRLRAEFHGVSGEATPPTWVPIEASVQAVLGAISGATTASSDFREPETLGRWKKVPAVRALSKQEISDMLTDEDIAELYSTRVKKTTDRRLFGRARKAKGGR